MERLVAYYRVSTQKQGQSGLGLEAQQEAVRSFAAGRGEVLATYTEIESGKRSDRPELAKAVAYAKRVGATLVIAKLDRLARNVLFIAQLMETKGLKFVACDNPQANELMLHILAAFAQHEASAISRRTKDALAAAKARGVRLGCPPGHHPSEEARLKGQASIKRNTAERHASIIPVIRELQASGVTTLHGLANALNARQVLTPRGGQWQAVQVQRVLRSAS